MSILLKKQEFVGVSQKELAQQIESKKKCKKKLPTWFNSVGIYYPKKLNVEQTSSELTALYKSQIVTGNSLVDVTGGFGVDSYFFSKKISEVFHCEIDVELAEIASHNFNILNATNVLSIIQDGISFVKESKRQFDCIYIDPSRRNDLKGKVFKFEDCSPNIIEHLEILFEKTDTILVKTSPLHDLSLGINELSNVAEIHVIAVNNEVKELLWLLKKDYNGSITIKTINLKKENNQTFDFNFEAEAKAITNLSEPLQYLYEPNAAILKSGAFKLIGEQLSLKKLHEHSHLYTSETLIDFPGRRFLIETILPYNKIAFKKLNIQKANVTTRNFPDSVMLIRKKLKIQDGGNQYLFFSKILDEKLIILKCKKIN
ncbi:THUMP-like domain-containing protein [Aurantibacter crassamenti]|uniref:THUMP-like domain-containing protein n=1 Tax=Aurantibacter crassamenti TaxID=1837375 RepID=UPI00293D979F|nr:class I SAM-dependent methyltransferase [Aurantibacter crassamenti]